MRIPRTDGQFMVWYKNFAARFAAHASALGFPSGDVEAVQADSAMLSYLIGDLVPAYEVALQVRSAYKNLIKDGPIGAPGGSLPPAPTVAAPPATVAPGIMPRVHQLVARIRVAPGYTRAIGFDLGIEEPDSGTAGAPGAFVKPMVKALALTNNQVQIDFTKGKFDGVLIESRRTGETGWTSLGTDNYSPFIDARPLAQDGKPEVREYRLRYMLRDEPVGDWSDITSATARP